MKNNNKTDQELQNIAKIKQYLTEEMREQWILHGNDRDRHIGHGIIENEINPTNDFNLLKKIGCHILKRNKISLFEKFCSGLK